MSEFDPSEQSSSGAAAPAAEAPPPPPPAAAAPPAATVVVEKKKSRAGMFFLGAFSGCLIVFVGFFLLMIAVAMSDGGSSGNFNFSDDKIAIVTIEGEILEARDTIEALQRHAENPMVKGIVVRINSPGGAIAPSQEIYAEIRRTREKSGKPVVASFDSVAASGGYYIAAACDEIVSNPGSITGSIGVILQWFNVKDLVQWAKMKPETITSGPMKAAGSPFEEMTPEERAYFQRIVSQLHLQFVKAVADGRAGKLTQAQVAQLADGRVFTGEEALALRLVDKLGNLDDAVLVAAKRAGIEGEPAKLWPRRRDDTLIELLTQGDAESIAETLAKRRMPRFLYRW